MRAVCHVGRAEMPRAGELLLGAPSDDERAFIWPAPGLSVRELLEAKGTPPLASAADLAADMFSSDAELEESSRSRSPNGAAASPETRLDAPVILATDVASES